MRKLSPFRDVKLSGPGTRTFTGNFRGENCGLRGKDLLDSE